MLVSGRWFELTLFQGSRWWLQAEDPWQCLACCFEITAALRSPDPTAYLSSLPVHQDGTCNGMQHYAALGGDSQGAKAVNLEGGDKPADVYTHIADLVNVIVNRDAEAGKSLAVAARGKVLRKVVKQTVMTTVYGESAEGWVRTSLTFSQVSHSSAPRTKSQNSSMPRVKSPGTSSTTSLATSPKQ